MLLSEAIKWQIFISERAKLKESKTLVLPLSKGGARSEFIHFHSAEMERTGELMVHLASESHVPSQRTLSGASVISLIVWYFIAAQILFLM